MSRPLPKGKNKYFVGVMKHELDIKIMKEFVGLTEKNYSHLINNGSEDKKVKDTKKCGIKKLKHEN